jgi:hypothetical protein
MHFTSLDGGECHVTKCASLEEERRDMIKEGFDPDRVSWHLTIQEAEGVTHIIDVLQALDQLEHDYNGTSQVRSVVTQIFNAGAEFGRQAERIKLAKQLGLS